MKENMNPIESEFNSGLALIYQLDAIERAMIEVTLEQNYHKHYRLLVAYFKTLCNQTTDKEEAIQIENWNKVRTNYLKFCDLERKGQKRYSLELLEIFDWWEIQLRNLKQKHGLGMPKKDMRFAMS